MHVSDPIIAALTKTARAYSQVFNTSYRSDPEWTRWYANYLLLNTDFQSLTPRQWTQQDLEEALGYLSRTYDTQQPRAHWTKYYAQRLAQ